MIKTYTMEIDNEVKDYAIDVVFEKGATKNKYVAYLYQADLLKEVSDGAYQKKKIFPGDAVELISLPCKQPDQRKRDMVIRQALEVECEVITGWLGGKIIEVRTARMYSNNFSDTDLLRLARQIHIFAPKFSGSEFLVRAIVDMMPMVRCSPMDLRDFARKLENQWAKITKNVLLSDEKLIKSANALSVYIGQKRKATFIEHLRGGEQAMLKHYLRSVTQHINGLVAEHRGPGVDTEE